MSRSLIHISVLAIALLQASVAMAQDENDSSIAYEIELRKDARMPGGLAAFLEGDADADGTRFFVAQTQLMQPISVGVYTRSPNESVRLQILKDDWQQPIREAYTQAGRADLHFRTYDGFRVLVSAATPTAYQLVVWVGDEQVPRLPEVALPASEYRERSDARTASAATGATDGPSSSLVWIIVGGLGVALACVGAFLLGRRRSRNA